MQNEGNLIRLFSSDRFITDAPDTDAYRVQSGSVIVFIAPLKKNGTPDRRIRLCEVEEGRLFPSFHFRDADYVQWRFIIEPTTDEAELLLQPGTVTSVLQRRFAKNAGLGNIGVEDFARSVVEFYNREKLKDAVYIGYKDQDESAVRAESGEVIRRPFVPNDERISGDEPLYRVMDYACRHSSIKLIDEEKLRQICGEEFNVPTIAKASRFGCRDVVLEQGWYHKDCGTIIGFIDGHSVACVPRGQTSYTIYRGDTGEIVPLTAEIANTIDPKALCIYRTLPGTSLGPKDLISFGIKSLRRADIWCIVILGLVGALIGIILPWLNQKIYDDYIPIGEKSMLYQICGMVAALMIGNLFFDMVKRLSEYRIGSHVAYDLQNAIYYRVFHLPESFFRQHESADLAQRLAYMGSIANTFVSSTLISGLGAVFALLYLYRMFRDASKLAWMAIAMLLIYAALLYFISRKTISFDSRIEEAKGDASAKLYQFLNGIEKLRIAGVEDRATYQYLIPFSDKQSLEISKNRVSAVSSVLSGSVSVLFSMVFYYIIVRKNVDVSVGKFMAFNSAFGSFSSSILNLIQSAINLYMLKPSYGRIKPVLETAPEDNENKSVPDKLRGKVQLRDVRFSYDKNGTNVLDGIDLTIEPGDYLGIVGSSGCGKSTLLKLLLGFEEPDQGSVSYDDQNLRELDKREVRKNLGVVLQNGKLIAGSIYENITITAPRATMKDVQSVIAAVGLKDDIDQMPMGVQTVLSENSGTISGGQQQRILIARAIISNPSILIFDEATSALDNVTQAAVSESLDKMNVTRIVVAHRLSTIKNCSRIIVLDRGRIVESGTYDQLMKLNGLFRQLAERQLV